MQGRDGAGAQKMVCDNETLLAECNEGDGCTPEPDCALRVMP